MLACIPGIGEKTANILWDEFGNATEALCYLTMLGEKKKIKGIGPKTIEKAREYIGILDVFELQVVPLAELMKGE
jgi:ERCC4-type nuclease